jgi:hypothetical protein
MSSNQTIKVFVRSKPLSGNDTTTTDRNVLNIDEAGSIISFSRDRKGQAEFQFSKVFGPSVSQQSVYNECSNVVIQEVTDGVNCCIMAYGQTGSGKSNYYAPNYPTITYIIHVKVKLSLCMEKAGMNLL